MTNDTFKEVKSLARFIDKAAARAAYMGEIPATSKQCFFLAKLTIEQGEDGEDFIIGNDILTKSTASDLIEIKLNA